jgi:hypothetical protein
MQDRYVIEVRGETAGLVVQEGRGFRFFASHPLYMHIDRQRFGSPGQAEQACRRARLSLVTYTNGAPNLGELRTQIERRAPSEADLARCVGG